MMGTQRVGLVIHSGGIEALHHFSAQMCIGAHWYDHIFACM